jgi:hypothetical protein
MRNKKKKIPAHELDAKMDTLDLLTDTDAVDIQIREEHIGDVVVYSKKGLTFGDIERLRQLPVNP